jgi:hypothetical protein
MSRLFSWLLLLMLFGVFALVAYFVLQARVDAGREMPHYSVYSEETDGLAATARFVRDLGREPVKLTRPVQQLGSRSEPRLLIMVEPQSAVPLPSGEAGIGRLEARGVLRWVAEGNTLVLCGRHGDALHRELGVELTTDLTAAEDETPRAVDLGEAGAYTAGIERLLMEGRDELSAPKGLPLWWLEGKVGAVLLRHGRGRVLVIADPSLLTRRGLVRADNCLLLYNILRRHVPEGRPVYFDEYHHGLRSGAGFWGYLNYHGQHWALLPVLAALAVAVWSMAIRLGPAVSPPQIQQTDAVDYASALARIYQGAGVRHLLADSLTRSFVARLTHHLGLRRSAPPAEILAAWGKRQEGAAPAVAVQQLEGLLRGAADPRKIAVGDRQLLFWTRAFDRFIKDHLAA